MPNVVFVITQFLSTWLPSEQYPELPLSEKFLSMYTSFYYTSREDTLILLDESYVSRLLATCVSVGSLTAVTIKRISTRCQGDDALAPVVKAPFYDSLYC